jgi:hypothetical protein
MVDLAFAIDCAKGAAALRPGGIRDSDCTVFSWNGTRHLRRASGLPVACARIGNGAAGVNYMTIEKRFERLEHTQPD